MEIERMCHRVAFLRAGKLVAVETVGALKGRSLHVVEVTFDDVTEEITLPKFRPVAS